MFKKLFYLFILMLVSCPFMMLSGCREDYTNENNFNSSLSENKASHDNMDQYKDTSSDKNSNDLNNNSSNKNSSNKITSDGGPVWSKNEHLAAEKFANELVILIKNRDINSISKRISYPFEMKIDGKSVKIPNKEKFVSIGFDKIFSNNLIVQINNTSKLFSNSHGFCLGETGEIWFSPMVKTNEIKIIAINNPS